jgi:hypothetical protein
VQTELLADDPRRDRSTAVIALARSFGHEIDAAAESFAASIWGTLSTPCRCEGRLWPVIGYA